MSLFRKATRSHAKLRLALIGPAGSGKTYSALAIGTNLIPEGRVAVIDTECGSAELYGNKFSFETMDLARHSPLDYVEAIRAAEAEGFDVVVIDSLSHAWMGKDGALEQVDKAVERGAGNSFSAWRSVTPKHNQLVDTILSCKVHLIATIRAKTEYVQEKNEKGKTEIKKLGMAAIQRDGLEFEFTCVGDLDLSNTLKISKTRLDGVIAPGDIFERPGAALAHKIRGWLFDGATPVRREAVPPVAPAPVAEPPSTAVSDAVAGTFAAYLDSINRAVDLAELDRAATGPGKPAKGTPEHAAATQAYLDRKTKLSSNGAQGAA
jgi:hypothetical protein